MIQASQFALNQNHALVENFHLLKPNPEHPKAPLHFMKGDPAEFGHKECKMSEEGYQILRDSIRSPSNHSYCPTPGTLAAREAVAKHFNFGQGITPDDVIITSGVNQGLLYALWTMCDPGTNIIVPEIGYPFFHSIAPAYDVEVRKYKLRPERNWEIDLEDLSKQLDVRTSFVFVINPSNMGSVFSKAHVEEVLQWAEDNCVLLVVDEVYFGMSFGEYHSFGQLVRDQPLICLGGMEKQFFVPGWQTSWIIFYDKLKRADKIKKAFANVIQLLLHTNMFTMNALPEILDRLGIYFAKEKCVHFQKNQEIILRELEGIKGLRASPAQGTIYLPVFLELDKFRFKSDTEFAQKLLEEENVMLLPLQWNGTDKYPGFRFLTIANEEVYTELFVRLKSFVERHLN